MRKENNKNFKEVADNNHLMTMSILGGWEYLGQILFYKTNKGREILRQINN